jgi:hypothetical protein
VSIGKTIFPFATSIEFEFNIVLQVPKLYKSSIVEALQCSRFVVHAKGLWQKFWCVQALLRKHYIVQDLWCVQALWHKSFEAHEKNLRMWKEETPKPQMQVAIVNNLSHKFWRS